RDRRPRAVRGAVHPVRGAAMQRRLTPGLALLRVAGFAALLLLFWNPVTSRRVAGDGPRLVLLDASLSMGGRGGSWREGLDSARVLAMGGGGGGGRWPFRWGVVGRGLVPPAAAGWGRGAAP